ncbi:hypothetical protein KW803_03410, partial [Candidatus Saccharibacteria bacterium]|nr:hypothetical protein [Candidatus Saccharibacteria bacterium]
ITDLSTILTYFNTTDSRGDADSSGRVDITDLSIVLSHYGQSYSGGGSSGSCVQSSSTWTNNSISVQTGIYNQTFTAKPSMNNIDADIGFSAVPVVAYSDLAAIVEFSSNGSILARNGAVYSAMNNLNYSANTTYTFRISINVTTHTYSMFVSPPGASEVIIASNYAFRTEQSSANQISNWATISTSGSVKVCGLPVSASPPPTSWSYTVAPPVTPGATITNMSGLGLNITTQQNISDKVIDGTGDTGVLFQLNAGGSTMNRVKMTRVAAGNSATFGKHGIYGKVPNLVLQDIDISCSANCASAVSLRYNGAQLRRFILSGAPHAITYYETSTTAGTVTIENGSGSFTGDTAIWMDAETDYTQQVIQRFVIKNVSFTGNGVFMDVADSRFASPSITVEHCFLNGRPVTAADLPGVPNVTILP